MTRLTKLPTPKLENMVRRSWPGDEILTKRELIDRLHARGVVVLLICAELRRRNAARS